MYNDIDLIKKSLKIKIITFGIIIMEPTRGVKPKLNFEASKIYCKK